MSQAKKLLAQALIAGHKNRKVVCDSKDLLIALSALKTMLVVVGDRDTYARDQLKGAIEGIERAMGHRE